MVLVGNAAGGNICGGQRQEKEKGKSEGEKTKRGMKQTDKGERVTLSVGDE